jgi:hypothetical protein
MKEKAALAEWHYQLGYPETGWDRFGSFIMWLLNVNPGGNDGD